MNTQMTNALELELRQLPGVSFVSFDEREGTTLIKLLVSPIAEQDRVREDAVRSAGNHLEGPVEVDVASPPVDRPQPVARDERVRLVLVLPSDGGAAIEVQLSRGGKSRTAKAVPGDTASVGRAVLEALSELGADTPFELLGFHALPSDWGAGVLAVLKDTLTGEIRRGVASGKTPAEASARAALDALNRSL